jgi:hypothetical protein
MIDAVIFASSVIFWDERGESFIIIFYVVKNFSTIRKEFLTFKRGENKILFTKFKKIHFVNFRQIYTQYKKRIGE